MKLVLSDVRVETNDSEDYYNDPFHRPNQFRLELIGDIEWDNESYQFNITAVWKDEEGRVWTADSSGCSCPVPFEDVIELDRLFNTEGLRQRYLNVRSLAVEPDCYAPDGPNVNQWDTFINAVETALAP